MPFPQVLLRVTLGTVLAVGGIGPLKGRTRAPGAEERQAA